nr:hypothetical protein [Bacillus cereus]
MKEVSAPLDTPLSTSTPTSSLKLLSAVSFTIRHNVMTPNSNAFATK